MSKAEQSNTSVETKVTWGPRSQSNLHHKRSMPLCRCRVCSHASIERPVQHVPASRGALAKGRFQGRPTTFLPRPFSGAVDERKTAAARVGHSANRCTYGGCADLRFPFWRCRSPPNTSDKLWPAPAGHQLHRSVGLPNSSIAQIGLGRDTSA